MHARHSMVTVLLLLWGLLGPAPAAPLPPLSTVDIRDYGAVPDDGISDSVPIRNAVEAVNNAGGGTVYFPPGVWDIRWLPLTTTKKSDMGAPVLTKPPQRISLVGAGPETILKRIPHANAGEQRRLMDVTHAVDFTMADMTIDMNRMSRFGGAQFWHCLRCTIQRTHWTDSNPGPVSGDYVDRLAFRFGGSPTALNQELIIVDNTIEFLQVDFDHVDGAVISGNVSTNAVGTGGFGSYANASNHVTRNMWFVNNTIINPAKSGFIVSLDFGTADPQHNVLFENIFFVNNTVRYQPQAPIPGLPPFGTYTTNAFRFGPGNNSIATTGNIYRRIQLIGNRVEVADGLAVSRSPLIFGNNSGTANILFDGVVVRHNRLLSAVDRPFVRVSRGPAASTVSVYDNTHQVQEGP